MLKMNRHFNSAGTSYLVSGLAPSKNMLTLFGNSALRRDGFGKLAAVPSGYGAPNSGLAHALKVGSMSAFVSCNGAGTATASGAEGRGISGQTDGVSTANAQGTALSWGSGSANGSSTVSCSIAGIAYITGALEGFSDASGLLFAPVDIGEMIGLAEGSCEITGSMSALLNIAGTASGIGGTEAAVTGIYYIEGTASGTSEASSLNLNAYGWMTGQVDGSCSVSVTPFAYGFMSGTTDVDAGVLTADSVATAVWSAQAVDNNDSGTMGNKLNTASSGGVDLNALADAVWEHQTPEELSEMIEFLQKVVKNKRAITSDKNLVVYDDNGTTPILSKALADKDGGEISDLASGVLAQEAASSV